jgi:uncharacterized membrane protein YjjP (DUF1212 family)
MPDPIFTFGFIVATLIGAVFHLVVGGEARRLALFLLASWLGFALGQVLGRSLNVQLLMLGEIHLFSAAAGSIFALFVAYILSTSRMQARSAPRSNR